MQSKGQEIHLYPESELVSSVPDDTVRLLGIEPVLQQRDSEVFEDSDPSKAARVLFDYYKKWI